MPIIKCVEHAFNPELSAGERPVLHAKIKESMKSSKTKMSGHFSISGQGLNHKEIFQLRDTLWYLMFNHYLGYVNRDSGIIEEAGHPLDGRAIEDTILVYPKAQVRLLLPMYYGSIYTGKGPKAILNRDICPLTLPAASLLDYRTDTVSVMTHVWKSMMETGFSSPKLVMKFQLS